jgi:catechol 2,3-dioxygenase-like lactoylglutathione lyase family enzyme
MSDKLLGGTVVCQVGLIVRDVERAAEAYSRILGLPAPEITTTGDPGFTRATYRGEPTDARARLAFFDLGQVQLELIEPIGAPSTWQEFLDEKGEGVHHIAFTVADTDEVTGRLAEQGIDVVQQGQWATGQYTYVETGAELGVILELLEHFEA